jgi:hypothetical protein
MSFRIHTSSPELQRDLEQKLAGLKGQLDGDFDYEITAEVLPPEQALERASSLAAETGSDSIFVAAGTFTKQEVAIPEPVHVGPVSVPEPQPEVDTAPMTSALQERRPPSFDAQKFRQSLSEKSAQARELSGKLASQTGSFMKAAGIASADAFGRASKWASQKRSEVQVLSSELKKQIAARAEESRRSAAEWNARRMERQAAEAKLRAERERAAHREAELAAAAAHIMHREQKKKEIEQIAVRQQPRVTQTVPQVAGSPRERDSWPIWRNAFATAACLALVGIFLLAAGGKQSKASPATSTEVTRPALPAALALPPVAKAAAQPKPAAQKRVGAIPAAKIAKPSPRRPIARTEDDGFQEVTVRHYPTASPAAPLKKDAKGVVQISDME